MRTIVIDVNEKNNARYSISAVTKEDWDKLIKSVILNRVQNSESIKLYPSFVNIRDNVAKVKICWEDDFYHEFECHVDEFGRKSKEYQDIVSQIWQNIMTEYYQEDYVQELNAKLEELKTQTI